MWPARTLGLLLALAPVGRAGADPPDPPTESGIVERSHRVDIRFVDGAAHLTVRREWVNLGSTPASASLTIEPPAGAAASGLRLRTRGAWVVGTLGAFSPRGLTDFRRLILAVFWATEACRDLHDPESSWSLPLQVETTFQEIVDVIPSREPVSAMDRCVVDSIWEMRIVWPITAKREMYTMDVRPRPPPRP